MRELKCPICGNDLEQYHTGLVCYRHCLNGKNVWGSEETLKEIDRTRKILSDTIKLAEEMLEDIEDEGLCSWEYKERLNKITAEQKDVK